MPPEQKGSKAFYDILKDEFKDVVSDMKYRSEAEIRSTRLESDMNAQSDKRWGNPRQRYTVDPFQVGPDQDKDASLQQKSQWRRVPYWRR